MQEKDPLETLFDRIAELTKMVKEGTPKSEAEFPPDVEEWLSTIEQVATLIYKINEQTLKNSKVSEEQVQKALEKIENFPIRDRRVLEKGEKLKEEVDSIQKNMAASVAIASQKEKAKDKTGAKPGSARKKKFRAMGGRKDWKRM